MLEILTYVSLVLAIMAIVQNCWIYYRSSSWAKDSQLSLDGIDGLASSTKQAIDGVRTLLAEVHEELTLAHESIGVLSAALDSTPKLPRVTEPHPPPIALDKPAMALAMHEQLAEAALRGVKLTVTDLVIGKGRSQWAIAVVRAEIAAGRIILDGPLRGDTRVRLPGAPG